MNTGYYSGSLLGILHHKSLLIVGYFCVLRANNHINYIVNANYTQQTVLVSTHVIMVAMSMPINVIYTQQTILASTHVLTDHHSRRALREELTQSLFVWLGEAVRINSTSKIIVDVAKSKTSICTSTMHHFIFCSL